MNDDEPVRYNHDSKFDIQLSESTINTRKLGSIFAAAKIEKIELKSESWLWERTGNICIEYRQNGRPSGIAVTQADYWVHELKRDGETLVYLMFPIERLKELAREAFRVGHVHEGGGDDGRFCNILIPLKDILR